MLGLPRLQIDPGVDQIKKSEGEEMKKSDVSKQVCQACEENHVQAVLKSTHERHPYKVCQNCLFNLVNHRLTRVQFKNLLKNGHKEEEFMLHSDFYDERGKALQPTRIRS